MSSVFSQLHENLQQALAAMQWQPTPIQESAIPDVIDGKDRLLIAPTGSGKTLSAILPILHRCITCLLYTSPSPRDGLLSRMPSSA